MLARMKKPHTRDMAVLSFLVPMASALQAKAYVEEQLGGQEIPEAESVSWRQAFPEWKEETACGVYLSGARHKEGLDAGAACQDDGNSTASPLRNGAG